MLRITYGKNCILDGGEFVSYYRKHSQNFDIEEAKKVMTAKATKDGNIQYFGYSINLASTIFSEADPNILVEKLNEMITTKRENIVRAFFNLELFNYHLIINGKNGYFYYVKLFSEIFIYSLIHSGK